MEGLYIQKMNFVIRPVTGGPEELAQIVEVYRQCEDFLSLGPAPRASLAMVEADLALSRKENGIFCSITLLPGAEMAGIVDFVPSGFEGDPSLAFLSLLMIAAPCRRRGLGGAVVQAIEEWIARDSRVRAVQSGVQANNPAAIRFWRRMGYEIVSRARLMEDGTVAYQLSKPLPGR